MAYKRQTCAAIIVFVYGLWISPQAHAYIDGGTASMLFQLLIGSLVAGSFMLRTFWGNVKIFFARLGGRGDPVVSESSSADETSTVDD